MEKIKRQRLFEQVAGRLEQMIAADKFNVGDRLPPERALAEKFGVNRLAVREALRTLETKQIVETRSGKGTFVIGTSSPPSIPEMLASLFAEDQLDLEALDEFFLIRRYLEIAVVKSAGPKLEPADFRFLRECLEGFKESLALNDRRNICRYDEQFHKRIASAGSGKVLATLADPIWDVIRKYQQFYFTHCSDPGVVLDFQHKILSALEAGRTTAAADLMEELLIFGDNEFTELLKYRDLN